jgi:septal ring factor EnvC (AmiA/AmiB activator)
MPSYNTMTLDEIDAALAQLCAKRKALKASSTTAQRKILTLARRRERLLQQVDALDQQIAQLRGGQQAPSEPVPEQRRSRRSQADVTACLGAIVACVQRHTSAQRGTIADECQLSPANASIYLRRLCEEGRLILQGAKSATTYTLPS